MKRVLAFDFGASSGRAILGAYEGGRLTYKEVHRFENNPREQDGHLRWNFADLMNNVRLGIEKAGSFDSIAFDTWGVDFGLLDEEGNLLEDPVHYRDSRTDGMTGQAKKILPAADLYAATGCQIMGINTLFQLMAVQKQQPELWAKARQLLFMPDLFAYALCGVRACETTIASTSQMLDARTGCWSKTVLDAFSVPESLFAPMVPSGTVLGEYKGAKVIAAAGHDTQCAVAALPAPQPGAAFLSCGTWSLLGCELDEPILTEESRTLALKYRFALEQLGRATGQNFSCLHIIGGGTQAKLLCRMTADSIGLPVVAGPIEATALGNILIQLVALDELKNLDEGRALIARTEPVQRYEPEQTALWNRAYETYKTILN